MKVVLGRSNLLSPVGPVRFDSHSGADCGLVKAWYIVMQGDCSGLSRRLPAVKVGLDWGPFSLLEGFNLSNGGLDPFDPDQIRCALTCQGSGSAHRSGLTISSRLLKHGPKHPCYLCSKQRNKLIHALNGNAFFACGCVVCLPMVLVIYCWCAIYLYVACLGITEPIRPRSPRAFVDCAEIRGVRAGRRASFIRPVVWALQGLIKHCFPPLARCRVESADEAVPCSGGVCYGDSLYCNQGDGFSDKEGCVPMTKYLALGWNPEQSCRAVGVQVELVAGCPRVVPSTLVPTPGCDGELLPAYQGRGGGTSDQKRKHALGLALVTVRLQLLWQCFYGPWGGFRLKRSLATFSGCAGNRHHARQPGQMWFPWTDLGESPCGPAGSGVARWRMGYLARAPLCQLDAYDLQLEEFSRPPVEGGLGALMGLPVKLRTLTWPRWREPSVLDEETDKISSTAWYEGAGSGGNEDWVRPIGITRRHTGPALRGGLIRLLLLCLFQGSWAAQPNQLLSKPFQLEALGAPRLTKLWREDQTGQADPVGSMTKTPKAEWDLVAINVTSLKKHARAIKDFGLSAAFFQEPRFKPLELRSLEYELGMQLCVPPALDDGVYLVSLAFACGSWTPVHLDLPVSFCSRCVAALWWPGGVQPVLLVSLYGFVDPNAAQLKALSDTLLVIKDYVVDKGGIKCFLSADLNADLDQLPATPWLSLLRWTDLGAEPTCLTATTVVPRRIDVLLASHEARESTVALQTRWDLGFRTHAAHLLRLSLGAPHQHFELQNQKPYSEPTVPKRSWNDVGTQIVERHLPRWSEALTSGSVDRVWDELQSMAHAYHHAIVESPLTKPRDKPQLKQRPDQPLRCFQGDKVTQEYLRVRRFKRVLQQWAFHRRKGVASSGPLWTKLWALADAQAKARLVDLTKGVEVQSIIEWARAAEDAALAAMRKARREGYHDWAQKSLAIGGRAVFRFVRAGKAPLVGEPLAKSPDGRWFVGKQGKVDRTTLAWEKFWCGPPTTGNLASLSPPLRCKPEWPGYRRLSAGALGGLASTLSPGKKAGWDGWSYADFKCWPPVLWERVAEFLELVEKGQRWPEQLRCALICMLLKGGSDDPIDLRPVALLPAIYRLWAALRVQDFRRAMAAAGLCSHLDGVPDAESQAVFLALNFEQAATLDDQVVAVALDFSKAYDRMPLGLLRELARAVDMPPWIVGPALDMYSATRRLKMDEAIGPGVKPTHGLIPGCNLATEWMALATWGWVQPIREIQYTRARSWVDDLTAYAQRGGEVVDDLLKEVDSCTDRMVKQGHFVVSDEKSGVIASTVDLGKKAAKALVLKPIAHRQAVKDLGVVQGHIAAAKPLIAKRWADSVERLKRIAMIPVGFAHRVWLAKASALAAGTYGAHARLLPLDLWRTMRLNVVKAVHRGSSQVSSGLWFLASGAGWRCDPVALLLTKAAHFAATAVKTKEVSEDVLSVMWALRSAYDGPINALKGGLLRIEVDAELEVWRRVDLLGRDCVLRAPLSAPWIVRHTWLCAAVRDWDARKVASGRSDTGLTKCQVSWSTLEADRARLKLAPDLHEALRSIQCGDAIVNRTAQHWNGGVVSCKCGADIETLFHHWWVCPLFASIRSNVLGHPDLSRVVASLPEATTNYLLPTWLPQVVEWRNSWYRDPWPFEDLYAKYGSLTVQGSCYVDGSGFESKDPHLRRVAWAVVYREDGRWVRVSGDVPGEQTVARAEAYAALVVLTLSESAPTIVTDCLSVWFGLERIRALGHVCRSLLTGPMGDIWERMAEPIKRHSDFEVSWMPSHKTLEEAKRCGVSQMDWEGNTEADAAAKAHCVTLRAPREIRLLRQAQRSQEAALMRIAARIHVATLAGRERAQSGNAVKQRARQAPVLPACLQKKPRLMQQQDDLAELRRWVATTKANEVPALRVAYWVNAGCPEPPVGLHWPILTHVPDAGHWPRKARGRFQLSLRCRRCEIHTADSGRWNLLLRTPCVDSPFHFAKTEHDLVKSGSGWRCSRCFLFVQSKHRKQQSAGPCALPALLRNEERATEAEHSLADISGWLTVLHAAVLGDAAMPAAETAPESGHDAQVAPLEAVSQRTPGAAEPRRRITGKQPPRDRTAPPVRGQVIEPPPRGAGVTAEADPAGSVAEQVDGAGSASTSRTFAGLPRFRPHFEVCVGNVAFCLWCGDLAPPERQRRPWREVYCQNDNPAAVFPSSIWQAAGVAPSMAKDKGWSHKAALKWEQLVARHGAMAGPRGGALRWPRFFRGDVDPLL